MGTILIVAATAVLVGIIILLVYCMRRDRNLVGFYKQINVCGRFYAFITADCLQVGAVCLIGTPVVFILTLLGVFDQNGSSSGWTICLTGAVTAAVMLTLGIFLYRRAAKKCDAVLKRALLKDMFIITWATAFRIQLWIAIIFIHTWFLSNCRYYCILSDGTAVYIYPGSNMLFNSSGCWIATVDNYGNVTRI